MQSNGASPDGDRATHERGQSALSPPPVGIPSAGELADLCEQMPSANRELDVLIAVTTDWRWDDWEEGESTARGQAEKHGIDWLIGRTEHGMASMWRHIPRYTASLDAAMRLLDDRWFFHVSRFSPGEGGGQAHVYPNRGLGDDYEADAAKPALALCAAALRARAASGTLTEGGDVKQAPGDSLSGPTLEEGDAHD